MRSSVLRGIFADGRAPFLRPKRFMGVLMGARERRARRSKCECGLAACVRSFVTLCHSAGLFPSPSSRSTHVEKASRRGWPAWRGGPGTSEIRELALRVGITAISLRHHPSSTCADAVVASRYERLILILHHRIALLTRINLAPTLHGASRQARCTRRRREGYHGSCTRGSEHGARAPRLRAF